MEEGGRGRGGGGGGGEMSAEFMRALDRREDIRQAFNLFEVDSEGYVKAEQVKQVFMYMGSQRFSDAEAEEMLATLKPDAQGRISFEAFTKAECFQVPLTEAPFRKRRGEASDASRTDAAGGSSG